MNDILFLFHHIHHENGVHSVHHCGGKHKEIDSCLDYNIEHCSCGKHKIDKEVAIGHATNNNLNQLEQKVKFLEKCPEGGWHIESGVIE